MATTLRVTISYKRKEVCDVYGRRTGHAMAQLIEPLSYKPGGRGFDSRWCHLQNPSGSTLALGSTQPLKEMSNRKIFWAVKAVGAWGWEPYHLHVPTVLKSGSINLLEPSGPVQACNGIAWHFCVRQTIRYCANWSGFFVYSTISLTLGAVPCNIHRTVWGWSLIFVFWIPSNNPHKHKLRHRAGSPYWSHANGETIDSSQEPGWLPSSAVERCNPRNDIFIPSARQPLYVFICGCFSCVN
jgi:hypothetical protein